MKILFSIINILLAFIAIWFLFIILATTPKLETVALITTFALVFIMNTVSIWKPLNIGISILQIVMTLVFIPIIKLIFAVALPFMIAIGKAFDPNLDIEQFTHLAWLIDGLCVLMFLSALYIAYQAYQLKRIRKKAAAN